MAIQWISRATGSKWYANSVYLCDPVQKNYTQKCFFNLDAYTFHIMQ